MARWQSCNILQTGKDGRVVWQFTPAGGKFKLAHSESRLPNEPLPAKWVAKDWQTLFQPKLNVAWLPADHVFLRCIQLPKTDELAEMESMVELQLEKLSPLPVAQIVWSFEVLPGSSGELQTVIVIIVAQGFADDYLGKIEAQGYLADRLELPLIDLVRATEIHEDGVWIYPGMGLQKDHCLVAWWYGGVLSYITLLCLADPETRLTLLKEHLAQSTWAGEIEGWLTGFPKVHLVAEADRAEPWLVEFAQADSAEFIPPPPAEELASRTARRVVQNSQHTNLMPPGYSARYKQQFVDRIWMRSLGALLAFYLLGIAVYFVWVEIAQFKLESLREQIAMQTGAYENAKRASNHVQILQEQVDLQYAALECWKSVAVHLPVELTLDSMNFDRGRKLTIAGSAAEGDVNKVMDFNEAIATAQFKDQLLFVEVEAPKTYPAPGGRIRWVFPCELRRADEE